MLSEGSCARHQKDHGPAKPQCGGMVGLTTTMVYNWRLLWWSLSWTQRKEHVLLLYVQSLRAHRATRLPDDRWRVQYTFLGTKVCRDAFMTLTGLSASVLHAARTDALAGKVSWSSRAERGLQGPGMLGNNSKAAAHIGARQWLEWYVDTHAEQSPMAGRYSTTPTGRTFWKGTGFLKPTPRMLAHMRWHRVGRSKPARLGAAARLRVLAHMRWHRSGRSKPARLGAAARLRVLAHMRWHRSGRQWPMFPWHHPTTF